MKADLKHTSKIYSDGSHCAFTDLIFWNEQYFAAFRKSYHHNAEGLGKIYIMKTSTPNQEDSWEHVATIDSGFDDRDPKFFTYEDMLGVVFGSYLPRVRTGVYETERYKTNDVVSHICLSYNGTAWSYPKQIGRINYWLWSIKELKFAQGRLINKTLALTFVPTHIGVSYHPITRQDRFSGIFLHVADGPYKWITVDNVCWGTLYDDLSEPALCIKNESLYCVIRKEIKAHTNKGYLVNYGETIVAYSDIKKIGSVGSWEYALLDDEIHSPCVLGVKDGILLAGRKVVREPIKATTEVFYIDDNIHHSTSLCCLDSRGDNSYPGMVLSSDHETLYVSYYSQHQVDIEKRNFITPQSDIYLACLELSS